MAVSIVFFAYRDFRRGHVSFLESHNPMSRTSTAALLCLICLLAHLSSAAAAGRGEI